jgi:hypothetical protein
MKFSIIIMRAIIMGVGMLNSFISNVIKIIVVILNVEAPKNCRMKRQNGCHSLSYRNKDDPTAVEQVQSIKNKLPPSDKRTKMFLF